MVSAAFCVAAMAACAKQLPGIPVLEQILVRSVFSVLLTAGIMRSRGVAFRSARPGLLLARCAVGFLGLVCYLEAVQRLPLGNAVVLLYTNPLFAGLFAALFLREVWKRSQIGAVVFTLLGAALVAKPELHAPLGASLLALASGVASGAAYTLVRALTRRGEDPLRIVFAFSLFGVPSTFLLMHGTMVLPNRIEWAWLIGLGITTQGLQMSLTYGLRAQATARATQIGVLAVVFGTLFGLALGDPLPTPLQAAGGALILLSLFLGTAKWGRCASQESPSDQGRISSASKAAP